MNELDEYLVCPITHEQVILEKTELGATLTNASRTRDYRFRDGSWDMIPDPLPGDLEEKSKLWQTLQENGAILYAADPMQNLTTDETFSAQLQGFLKTNGRVLDIGCGPQRHKPRYLESVQSDRLVGIDPLPGEGERDFNFIKAIAEALPFADATFDNVVFCRTLDHMIDFRAALRSAIRVAVPGGAVCVLMDDVDESSMPQRNAISRLKHLATRGTAQIAKSVRTHDLKHALGYAWKASTMKIPEGAMDYFHSYFPMKNEVVEELEKAGASHVDVVRIGDEILVTAYKRAD